MELEIGTTIFQTEDAYGVYLGNQGDMLGVGADSIYQGMHVEFETDFHITCGSEEQELTDLRIANIYPQTDKITAMVNTRQKKVIVRVVEGADFTHLSGQYKIRIEGTCEGLTKSRPNNPTYLSAEYILKGVAEAADGVSYRLKMSRTFITKDERGEIKDKPLTLTAEVVSSNVEGFQNLSAQEMASTSLAIDYLLDGVEQGEKRPQVLELNGIGNTINPSKSITARLWYKEILIDTQDCFVIKDGASSIYADLDNEMDSIITASDGVLTSDLTIKTNAVLYRGTESLVLSDVRLSCQEEGVTCTYVLSADKKRAECSVVLGTAFVADKATVNITLSSGVYQRELTFVVNKIKVGEDAFMMSLSPDTTAIKVTKDQTLYPAATEEGGITCLVNRTEGQKLSVLETLPDGWSMKVGIDDDEPTAYEYGTRFYFYSKEKRAVKFYLYFGTILVDKETIPIIIDGLDGKSYEGTTEWYYASKSANKEDLPSYNPRDERWKSQISGLTNRFSKEFPYLWNFEVVNIIEDGELKQTATDPEMISYWAANGKGVKSIEERYRATRMEDSPKGDPTDEDATNSKDAKFSEEQPYLWNNQRVVFDDDTFGEWSGWQQLSHWGRDGEDAYTLRCEYEFVRAKASDTFITVDGEELATSDEDVVNVVDYTILKCHRYHGGTAAENIGTLKYALDNGEEQPYTEEGVSSKGAVTNVRFVWYSDEGARLYTLIVPIVLSEIYRYSADKVNWHEALLSTDIYMQKSDDGGKTWSEAIRIVGEDGAMTEYDFGISASYIGAPPSDLVDDSEWHDAPVPTTEEKPYEWMRVRHYSVGDNGKRNISPDYTKYQRISGMDSIRLDLDNEMDTMLYNGKGVKVSGDILSNIRVFNGSREVTYSAELSISAVGCTATLTGKTIKVVSIEEINAKVDATAVYNGQRYTKTLSLIRKNEGDKYSISVNPNDISYNTTTKISSTDKVTVNVYRTFINTDGNVKTELCTELPEGYVLKENGLAVVYAHGRYVRQRIDFAKVADLRYELLNVHDGVEDYETVPINKVTDGVDVYILDLDNEMTAVLCHQEGKPMEEKTAVTNVSFYRGIDFLEFRIVGIACPNGIVCDTAASDSVTYTEKKRLSFTIGKETDLSNPLEIVITCADKHGDNVRDVVMTIVGILGTTSYELLTSTSQVMRNPNGNQIVYDPSTVGISALIKSERGLADEPIYKVPSSHRLWYGTNGETPTLSIGEDGNVTDAAIEITEQVGSVEFYLCNTNAETFALTDVVDKERVYVVSDGLNGKSYEGTDEYYYASATDKVGDLPSYDPIDDRWKPTVSELTNKYSEDYPYLWNFEVVKMTLKDGSSLNTVTKPELIAYWSTDGVGVIGVDERYRATAKSDVPTDEPTEGDAVNSADTQFGEDLPYLWNVQRVIYDTTPVSYGKWGTWQLLSHWGRDGESAYTLRCEYIFATSSTNEPFISADGEEFHTSDEDSLDVVENTILKCYRFIGGQESNEIGILKYAIDNGEEQPYPESGVNVLGAVTSIRFIWYGDENKVLYTLIVPIVMGETYRYSADKEHWHEAFLEGDLYMQASKDGGKTWGDIVRIVGEDAAETTYDFGISMYSVGAPPSDLVDESAWHDAPVPTTEDKPHEWMRIRKYSCGLNGKRNIEPDYTKYQRTTGLDSVHVDLDNEMDSMLYNGSGEKASGDITSNIRVFEGSRDVTQYAELSIVAHGCVAALRDNTITVTALSENKASVQVKALYKGRTYVRNLTLIRKNEGDKYDLVVIPNDIAYNATTAIASSNTVKAEVYRTFLDSNGDVKTELCKSLPNGFVLKENGLPVAYANGKYEHDIDFKLADIRFELLNERDGVEDYETIPINKVSNGEGASPIFADLDNEMDSVITDSEGNFTGTKTLTTNVAMYYGIKELSPTITCDNKPGVTVSISGNKVTFSVTKAAADKTEMVIVLKADVDGSEHTRNLVFTINKVKIGAKGENAIMYSLNPDCTAVKVAKDGTLTPTATNSTGICCYVNKSDGDKSPVRLTSLPDKWSMKVGRDGGTPTAYTIGSHYSSYTKDTKSVEFYLYYDGTVIDKETIPVIMDGTDGTSPVAVDIDNEMTSVACDVNGNPTAAANVSTTASLYVGSSPKTITDISVLSTLPTGITRNASVTKPKIRFDIATNCNLSKSVEITLKITDGSHEGTAVMTINGVKPGANGEPATIYEILTNPTQIVVPKDGETLGAPSPNKVSAQIQKTVGEKTTTLSGSSTDSQAVELKYRKNDTGDWYSYPSTGDISVVNTDTKVTFELLKNGTTTVLDRETVPLVKDGLDGKSFSLNEKYGVSNNENTQPTTWGDLATAQSGWGATNKYLWNQEVVVSNGTTTTDAHIMAIWTKDGVGIQEIREYYLLGTETEPSKITVGKDGKLNVPQGWSTTEVKKTTETNRYVWNQEVVVLTDGTYQVGALHTAGVQGKTGDAGKGEPGATGCAIRIFQYEEGTIYYNDSGATTPRTTDNAGGSTNTTRWIDVVQRRGHDGKIHAYMVKPINGEHAYVDTSIANKQPFMSETNDNANSDAGWVATQYQPILATDVLLAENAYIKMAQSNKLLLQCNGSTQHFTAGASGGTEKDGKHEGYAFWAGTNAASIPKETDIDKAAFSVTHDGKLKSTKGNIGGFEINSTQIQSGNKNIILNSDGSAKIGGVSIDNEGNTTVGGIINAVGGLRLSVEKITLNEQTISDSCVFAVIEFPKDYFSEDCTQAFVNLPEHPMEGTQLIIKNYTNLMYWIKDDDNGDPIYGYGEIVLKTKHKYHNTHSYNDVKFTRESNAQKTFIFAFGEWF